MPRDFGPSEGLKNVEYWMYFHFFKLHDWGKRSGSCRSGFFQSFQKKKGALTPKLRESVPRRSAKRLCPYSMWCSTDPSVIRVSELRTYYSIWQKNRQESIKPVSDGIFPVPMWILDKSVK